MTARVLSIFNEAGRLPPTIVAAVSRKKPAVAHTDMNSWTACLGFNNKSVTVGADYTTSVGVGIVGSKAFKRRNSGDIKIFILTYMNIGYSIIVSCQNRVLISGSELSVTNP